MAENSRLFRQLQLQLISATARKFNHKVCSTPRAPTVLKSLPEHRPLLPLLLSHGIPHKFAEACAHKYDRQARKLRLEAESRLAPYLAGHGNGQPAKVYGLFLNEYNKTLRNWAQIVLSSALKNLKREFKGLNNWEVMCPEILWLPSPPNPPPAHRPIESICPLSTTSSPSHAFPTIYPPPLRPAPAPFPVEWRRVPAGPSNYRSTAIGDLDSLCLRFKKALVIDENPKRPPQSKASIFSLPCVSKVNHSPGRFSSAPARRKLHNPQHSQSLKTSKPAASPLKTPKTRQLSVPPSFFSPFPRVTSTLRKTSAPTRVPIPQYIISSSQHTASTSPSLPKLPVVGTKTRPSVGPDVPALHWKSPLDSPSRPAALTSQDSSGTLPSPTTPPTLFPELFTEPVIVPSTPVYLSPGPSSLPVADPFLRFQWQHDHSPEPSLIPTCEHGGLTPQLDTRSFFSKSAFDTPFRFSYPSNETPATIMSDALEHLRNTCTLF